MKKNVLFVMQSMAVGGISTSLVNLLEYIEEIKNDNLNIYLLNFAKTPEDENLPDFVNVIYANKNLDLVATPFRGVIKSKKIFDILRRIMLMIRVRVIGSEKFYRNELKKIRNDKKYDVAISYTNDVPGTYFNQGTNLYVADYVDSEEKIAWIHTDPIEMKFCVEHCKNVYEKYDRIICVSRAIKEKFDKLLPDYAHKTEVFYNVFNEKKIRFMAEEYIPFEKKEFSIVTVCRIDNSSKRIDGIIRLCHRLKNEGISCFKWRIVGDGVDLRYNIELAKKLNVTDVVEFVGEKRNPYPYMLCSDLFALYSAYEGHPMVIGEAQTIGTYILTTNYGAAGEQINKLSGQIAVSDEDFFERIRNLILNN